LFDQLTADYLDCENICFGSTFTDFRLSVAVDITAGSRENPSRKVSYVSIVLINKVANSSHLLIAVLPRLLKSTSPV